jgi:RimJ/RimL family protein N-acetyltransferase
VENPSVKPYLLDEPLTTERLVLRAIEPRDFDDVHSYMGREDVARWLLEDAYSLEKSTEKHPIYSERVRLENDGDLMLVAIEFHGRVVGDLDCTLKSVENQTFEIGWRIHPDVGGQGIATEAARALLALLFDVIGARRVVAELDPRNGGSARLCERLGMRREATFVEHMWLKGEWSDTAVFAILSREWRSAESE